VRFRFNWINGLHVDSVRPSKQKFLIIHNSSYSMFNYATARLLAFNSVNFNHSSLTLQVTLTNLGIHMLWRASFKIKKGH